MALFVPFTFAISPVVAMVLLAAPVLPAPGGSVARLVVLALVAVAVVLSWLQRRCDIKVASNTVALPLLLIGVYPAAFALLLSVARISEGRFATFYLVVCAVLACLAYRTTGLNSRSLHHSLAVVALVFFVFSLSVLTRVYWYPKPYSADVAAAIRTLVDAPPLEVPPGGRPDVYHLVLDGMGRPDVLAAKYDLHLDSVLEEFRQLGFQVDAGQGSANYVQTHLSLASMLNMSYLDELTAVQGTSTDRRPLRDLISSARVPTVFKRLGYRVEFIGSGYLWNGVFQVADACDCPQLWFADPEIGALSFTPLKVLPLLSAGLRFHYRRVVSTFDRLERVPADDRPRYVFAHLMIPHPPFVVDRLGQFTDPGEMSRWGDGSFFLGTNEEYSAGYRAQATFALKRALLSVRSILAEGERAGRATIVIIHGDHGPRLGFNSRQPTPESGNVVLPVFMAIRTPQATPVRKPPLSLVNVYRAVFRDVFGADVAQLPDRGFVSGFGKPYDTIAVERAGPN